MPETAADPVAVPAGGEHSDHRHHSAAADEIADMADVQAGAGHENLRRDQREADVSADRQTGDRGELKHKGVLKRAKDVRLFAGGEPLILRGKFARRSRPARRRFSQRDVAGASGRSQNMATAQQ